MKLIGIYPILLLFGITSAGLGARAVAGTVFEFNALDWHVPDGSAVGLSDTRTIASEFTEITDISVRINLSGGFNGDLYVQLTHDAGFTVLLNRPGRSPAQEFGYADSGFDVEFSDDAPLGDIHIYTMTLSTSGGGPLAGPLTGIWAPDGRRTDPELVLSSDPRTAMLSSFHGLNPNGAWTLFVADLESGGISNFNSWALEITAIPEPAGSFMIFAGFLAVSFRRRVCKIPPGFPGSCKQAKMGVTS